MAAIAFGGHAAAAALQGKSVGAWIAVGIAAVIWLVVAVAGRRILRRWRADDRRDAETAATAPAP
jgi:membrane protein implicated in regulation of membrane protease activity